MEASCPAISLAPDSDAESAVDGRALRVGLFTDADVFAGTERHMMDLAIGLRTLGVDVTILCPTPAPLAEKASAQGIRVVSVAKRGLIDVAAIKTVRRLIRSGELDIVHSHNGRTALSAALGVWLARRGHCVTTQHFISPNRAGARGLKAVLSHTIHGWVSRRTAQFIAISDAARQGMLQRGDAPESKIRIVPNGIAVQDPSQIKSISAVREELGLTADAKLIVTVARLEKEKDIVTLISAMSLLKKRLPTARCVIAGEGTERAALEAEISRQNAGDAVTLLGFRSDAASLINAADVFVLPSRAEPFGLVLLEAMSLAKPIIACNAGGPVEIVRDGLTGLLVPPLDPGALAGAIESILSDADLARRLGQAGHDRYAAHFTDSRMAQDVLSVYRNCAASDR